MSLKRNTLWNLLGAATPMAMGVVAVPYIYHRINAERLGVITIVWALIGYFSIFDFGLGRAITQRLSASLHEHSDNASIKTTATTGVFLTFMIGLIGAAIGFAALKLFGVGWINASKSLTKEVYTSLLLACFAVPATTATGGMRGILEGLQKFGQMNVLKFMLGISNFVGPILSIYFFGPSLPCIVAFLVAGRLFIMLAHFYVVRSYLTLKGHVMTVQEARSLFQFGGWMTLSNIISPLMVVADRFFISNLLGAALVAYYTVPADFLIRLLILPAAVTTAAFPMFSRSISVKDEAAASSYRKVMLLILIGMGSLTATLSIGSKWGLTLWLGHDFAQKSYAVASVLAVGVLFNSLAQIPFAFIQASGDARTTAMIHILEIIIYIPILLLMVKIYGVTGAAMAWTMRALLDLILLHSQATRVKNTYCNSYVSQG